MVGGVISDIYHAEDRNTPMALFSGAALFGTGLAPLLSSVITYHSTWRWIYYSHAIVAGVFTILIFLFFKETRGSVILSRKAAALNKYYEALEAAGHFGVILADSQPGEEKRKRIRWKVKSDEQRQSLGQMISISCYRPFRESTPPQPGLGQLCCELTGLDMLCTEPVVFFFSLWAAFSWAVLYLQFGSVPLVFQTNHGFNLEQSGAVFTCKSIARATLISTDSHSYVCRCTTGHDNQHLPGKDCHAVLETPADARGAAVLCLCAVCVNAHRVILVWLDVVLVCPLDCTHISCRLFYDGYFVHLSRCL